jgi:sulfur carrier protein ThiS
MQLRQIQPEENRPMPYYQKHEDSENLERIADALERLAIAADSIATALEFGPIAPQPQRPTE